MANNSSANAGDVADTHSTLGSGSSLEEEMATHSSILAWEIPWTEELGVWVCKESDMTDHVHTLIE